MKKLLTIVATLALSVLGGVGTARAQVVDAVLANIPFDFTVGKVTLPAGQYTVKPFGSLPGNLMAISNREGKIQQVFIIEDTQANQPPQQAELIFHRVGDQYFLYKVFDPENRIGAELPKPRAERRLEKEEAVTGSSSYVTVAALNASSER